MKRLCLFLCMLLTCFCMAQNKSSAPAPEIIKIKKYNIEKEIKNGQLTFLKGCFWTETIKSKTRTVSVSRSTPDVLIGKRGAILIEKIKKKNPDGSFTNLPSKQLIIE